MQQSAGLFRAVMAVELELLDAAVRRDPARVAQVLHAEFFEIGRSGCRWTRGETLAALAAEQGYSAPEADEWLLTDVSPALILATYRVTGASGISRHCSLWDVSGAVPVIRYHQGTMVPARADG